MIRTLNGNKIPTEVQNAAYAAAQKYSLPYLGILSTWALESRWGLSSLVKTTNNPFNIKGCSGYLVTGCTKAYDKIEKSNDGYRKYATLKDGFDAYGQLITNGRYKGSSNYVNDPIGFFKHLKSKGYATDVNYVSKLTSILNTVKNEVGNNVNPTFSTSTSTGINTAGIDNNKLLIALAAAAGLTIFINLFRSN